MQPSSLRAGITTESSTTGLGSGAAMDFMCQSKAQSIQELVPHAALFPQEWKIAIWKVSISNLSQLAWSPARAKEYHSAAPWDPFRPQNTQTSRRTNHLT